MMHGPGIYLSIYIVMPTYFNDCLVRGPLESFTDFPAGLCAKCSQPDYL